MTDPKVQSTGNGEVSADDIRAVKFNRVLGRGYEQHEVDAFVTRCAAWVDWFHQQLLGAQREVARLHQQATDSHGDQIQRAIRVLTNAQQTADTTVQQADQYSLRVMSEAKQMYEEARARTAALEQETQVRTKRLTEDTSMRAEELSRDSAERAAALLSSTQQRAAALEREARAKADTLLTKAAEQAAEVEAQMRDRLHELGEITAERQAELDKQTAYLRTLRDASRIQMQKFLEGMLDHLSDEYGRADPAAAQAVATARPTIGRPAPARRLVVRPKRSVRRSFRPVPLSHVPSNGAVPRPRPKDQH